MKKAAALFMLAALSCGPGARLREGDAFLAENKFDLALLSYQQAYLASPTNAKARWALGRMLTMRRISFHAGLDLMKAAYDSKPEPQLRTELLVLHLDTGDIKRAEELVHPDRMSTEEYRTAEAALERAAASCMRKQNEEGYYGLKNRPDDPFGQKQGFLIRCLLSPGWRKSKLDDAKAVFLEIPSNQTRCELTMLFPEVSNLTAEYCKGAFPDVIAIHRKNIHGIEAKDMQTAKLFDSDLFVPGDPPPQLPDEPGAGPTGPAPAGPVMSPVQPGAP